MNKNIIITLLLLMVSFTACKNDKGNKPDPIKKETITLVSDKKVLSQEVFANDSEESILQPITFKTTGAWKAVVREGSPKANTEVSWVKLSQTSGSTAGEYTITITLEDNYTGKPRVATIDIISDDQTISIIVKQAGVTEEGNVHQKLISKITKVKSSVGDDGSKVTTTYITSFEYDDKNRPVKITYNEANDLNKNKYDEVITLNYVNDKEVHISLNYEITTFNRDGEQIKNEDFIDSQCKPRVKDQFQFVAHLNDAGYITSFDVPFEIHSSYPYCSPRKYEKVNFGYNEGGYLIDGWIRSNWSSPTKDSPIFDSLREYTLTYNQDKLVSYVDVNHVSSEGHLKDQDIYEVETPINYYSTISNQLLNYDMNELDLDCYNNLRTGLFGFLKALGFLGEKSSTVINQVKPMDAVPFEYYKKKGELVAKYIRNVTPGKEIKYHSLTNRNEITDGKIVFSVDNDGLITTRQIKYTIVLERYDLFAIVGDAYTAETAPYPGDVGTYPAYYERCEKVGEKKYQETYTTTYEVK